LARAAAFGVATLALAAGAHVAAGGALPSMTVFALLAIPVTMAALALTGRRCGAVLLLGSMAGAQALLHETLSALTAHVPTDVAGQMSAASGSAMSGHAMAQGDGWSLTMTAAHVAASVVAALLLARGEQALWQLVSRLLPALPSDPCMVGSRRHRTSALISVSAWAPSVVSGGRGLRGPPARFAAAA
jgi:hypothetical protein